MESILWALDLLVVTWLCLWVLKAEKRKEQEKQAQLVKMKNQGRGNA